MKTTIIILMLLMAGLVSAYTPFDNLKSNLDLRFEDNITVVGVSSKYGFLSNHTATDILKGGKSYTVFMSKDNYDDACIVSYLMESRIQELEEEVIRLTNRIQIIEDNLDITDLTIPQEPETDLYNCSYKESKECLGGLSRLNDNNVSTRCYNYLRIGWSTCSTGWEIN